LNTCVALVGAYLRFNGYVTVPEQPVLIGQGKPYRYHTATDVDILAVRFPNAAVVVPREYGSVEDDLHLEVDSTLELEEDTVDILVGEVKSGRPRLNDGLRDRDVLYATLKRVDPGFDVGLDDTITHLIRNGEAQCKASGKKWRFRLVAFGEGQPAPEGGPYMVVQMRHVAAFLMQTMREHHQVWKDAQFGDPVLDILHLFDKMGFAWTMTAREVDEQKKQLEEQKKKPKPRQNEKIASIATLPERIAPTSKPRVKPAVRKNGGAPKAPVPRRKINNDGWIPGGG
jgi:hypothetical protein